MAQRGLKEAQIASKERGLFRRVEITKNLLQVFPLGPPNLKTYLSKMNSSTPQLFGFMFRDIVFEDDHAAVCSRGSLGLRNDLFYYASPSKRQRFSDRFRRDAAAILVGNRFGRVSRPGKFKRIRDQDSSAPKDQAAATDPCVCHEKLAYLHARHRSFPKFGVYTNACLHGVQALEVRRVAGHKLRAFR